MFHFYILGKRFTTTETYHIGLKWVDYHYVESVRIRSFCGPYYPTFALNAERYSRISPYSVRMLENTDQKNSKYGHFSLHAVYQQIKEISKIFGHMLSVN